MNRHPAALSLDLDNHWSYLRTRGDAAGQGYPSYLGIVVPRVLEFLRERSPPNHRIRRRPGCGPPRTMRCWPSIAAEGHEIGNHSHNHEPWLHRLTPDEVRAELSAAHAAIVEATGVTPRGFRGPGFSLSDATLAALVELGYRYDGSTLPTFVGPLARAYYFRSAGISDEEREQRAALFGDWREGFRPIRPYRWRVGSASLVEIPVTTMPWFRLPFHFSYLLYAAETVGAPGRRLPGHGLRLCRLRRSAALAPVAPARLPRPERGLRPGVLPRHGHAGRDEARRLDGFLEAVRRHFELRPMGNRWLLWGEPPPSCSPFPFLRQHSPCGPQPPIAPPFRCPTSGWCAGYPALRAPPRPGFRSSRRSEDGESGRGPDPARRLARGRRRGPGVGPAIVSGEGILPLAGRHRGPAPRAPEAGDTPASRGEKSSSK